MKIRSILALGTALLAAIFVMVASAQTQNQGDRAPFWPAITNKQVVNEWYSDVPWHQKFGTFSGNQIDEPLILPYAALPQASKDYCAKKKLSDAECMVETGVTNILGMQRVDTVYATPVKTPDTAPPEAPRINNPGECQDPSMPCIEVMLKVGNYYATADDSGVKLAPHVYGDKDPVNGSYLGYTITDGTTFGPQLPWYMSHYCDAMFAGPPFNDALDPVCYADYFSTMNSGFNAWGVGGRFGWPYAVPWSVWPQYSNNHCFEGITVCNIVLATIDLAEVPRDFPAADGATASYLMYPKYNDFLLQWFNYALKNFPTDQGTAENQRHFPWSGNPMTWDDFYPQSALNPFLGAVAASKAVDNFGCVVTLTGASPPGCTATEYRAKTLFPRECTLDDLAKGDATRLRKCGINYELHHNGWIQSWPADWNTQSLSLANIIPANQYGRTSFLFAGVPGFQLPVSFYRGSANKGYSIYEQVYNTSIFSLYLPIANEADTKRAFADRQYSGREFYHTLLMTNHMEAEPQVFAEGIRGRTLWHNEYRMQGMYDAFLKGSTQQFQPVLFDAAFDGATAKLPFHGETCDSCHVRNGSGIPINTNRTLDAQLQEFMTGAEYQPKSNATGTVFSGPDYTFTGNIHPMKLVFFDLLRSTLHDDGSEYSEPKAFTPATLLGGLQGAPAVDLYYSNAIMNFYGDSFHVTQGNSYQWSYVEASADSLVVATQRKNSELGKIYTPWQVKIKQGSFNVPVDCQIVTPAPKGKPWPATCSDVSGDAIESAINDHKVGYMLLNGKRLGNSSAIEAMPNDAIIGFRENQIKLLGPDIAGELIWTVGSRDGVGGTVKNCLTRSSLDCYIGRFGWLGDRASLEDQVANAAFVEMNMTSSAGYKKLYGGKATSPIRYAAPNCGPADKVCVANPMGNRDLSEQDIERMAEYARWIGNPTRSEFQVQLPEVIAGETVFRRLKCDTCHVIDRIDFNPEDTMLSKAYRDRLKNRYDPKVGGNKPFLSYLGTDLLMHDMGYLSQVGVVPTGVKIRDPATGVVLAQYQNFVQKIRTPALKGMRFNRFVTDSQANTKNPGDPACDFLMHDGRACDAIEAAFMHDGPAIKKLGIIEALNALSALDVQHLRAFLYSL